jgi:hypothetical protein
MHVDSPLQALVIRALYSLEQLQSRIRFAGTRHQGPQQREFGRSKVDALARSHHRSPAAIQLNISDRQNITS